jgi:amino acid transporter
MVRYKHTVSSSKVIPAPPESAAADVTDRRVRRENRDESHKLTALGGLAALSLDALSSVAYGPEAIVVVLVAAGAGAVRFTLPISAAIAALLIVLVVSYRQVIAVHPDGGGAYAVAKKDLTPRLSLLAAASLVVDYVLTVAVSLAAGAASLGSVFPWPTTCCWSASSACSCSPRSTSSGSPSRLGRSCCPRSYSSSGSSRSSSSAWGATIQ